MLRIAGFGTRHAFLKTYYGPRTQIPFAKRALWCLQTHLKIYPRRIQRISLTIPIIIMIPHMCRFLQKKTAKSKHLYLRRYLELMKKSSTYEILVTRSVDLDHLLLFFFRVGEYPIPRSPISRVILLIKKRKKNRG